MPELDYVKERIGHYKLWLGILVVTNIGLFGWLVTNFSTSSPWIINGSLILIYVLLGGIILLEDKIRTYIEKLREL